MNHQNNKPVNLTLTTRLCFYHEELKPDIWGSNDIAYEIYYHTDTGIMRVFEIGAFGDAALVKSYKDKRGRGITLKEMLENIEEMSNMTLKEFREKVLKC